MQTNKFGVVRTAKDERRRVRQAKQKDETLTQNLGRLLKVALKAG